MIDSKSSCREVEVPKGKCTWTQRTVLGLMCALVTGLYAYMVRSGLPLSGSPLAADNHYNLLAQAFHAGQLSLKTEVPPGLVQLADPYNPTRNALYRFAPYGLYDLTYYKGRLYLDSGITPVVLLFWPYVALTGRFLSYGQAGVIFCTLGFLASVALLGSLWRRYFAQVSVAVVAAGTLGLGLSTFIPLSLVRCDIYEVAVACGYAFIMLALAAIWKASEEPRKRSGWLAAASLAYGLAVGARPSLLFGSVILVVPVVQAYRERRPSLALLPATTCPILLVGLGLMTYNFLRFDNPFEFGWHYVLAAQRQDTAQAFHLRYLWFNFQLNFLEPTRWSAPFPFVHPINVPPLPAAYGRVERPFGVLTNFPVVWLALAAPMAYRGQLGQTKLALRWFLLAVGLLFGLCALTICLFWSANLRYEVDFLPALVLLAVVGILNVECALVNRRVWFRAACLVWILLLSFSLVSDLLASVERCAEVHCTLGIALMGQGRLPEAIGQYDQALRLKPDFAEAHYNLGIALDAQGRVQEAIGHYEEALKIAPRLLDAHNNLGIDLMDQGRLKEAIPHYQEALRIQPDYVKAQCNWGNGLLQAGSPLEAIGHYQQALQIAPDFVEAHFGLGLALEQLGRTPEAIQQYQDALRINPDFVQARNALARALSHSKDD